MIQFDCIVQNDSTIQNYVFTFTYSSAKSSISMHSPFNSNPLFTPRSQGPPHLDGVGVVLWAADHARRPVEAGRRLEGDCEVVGLRDVLHGGGAGVGLHDGGKLERQHEGEQLLQYGATEGGRGEWEKNHGVVDTSWWLLKQPSYIKPDQISSQNHNRAQHVGLHQSFRLIKTIWTKTWKKRVLCLHSADVCEVTRRHNNPSLSRRWQNLESVRSNKSRDVNQKWGQQCQKWERHPLLQSALQSYRTGGFWFKHYGF